MSVKLQFYGIAGYSIFTSAGVHVVVDPFLNNNPYSKIKTTDLDKVDLLLITHNAFDHFGDAPEIINKHKCKVICALDVLHHLVKYFEIDRDLIRPTIWGMLMEECGVSVAPVESHHWSFSLKEDGQLLSGPAMGFVIDAGEKRRIYHPGDTGLFSDMKLIKKRFKPTIGLMHVSLPLEEGVGLPHPECYKSGELTPEEALIASEWLGISDVVTSHYVDPECADVKIFLELVEQNKKKGGFVPTVHVLPPGETIEWEKPN